MLLLVCCVVICAIQQATVQSAHLPCLPDCLDHAARLVAMYPFLRLIAAMWPAIVRCDVRAMSIGRISRQAYTQPVIQEHSNNFDCCCPKTFDACTLV